MNLKHSGTGSWRRFAIILSVCLSLFFLFSVPGEALRLKTNWAQRVGLSEKIIQGQVLSTKSFWNHEQGLIFTNVTFLVDEHIMGNGQREVIITIPGGTVGDETHLVSETPQLSEGDYGVVLLEPSGQVTGGPGGFYLFGRRMTREERLQSLTGDRFLSWIKDYVSGRTRVSFETASGETDEQTIEQEVSFATISGVSPSTISAGTGDILTISGSGFGSSRGFTQYPTIGFRYQGDNYVFDNSKILSWSDTQIRVEVFTGVVNNYDHSPGSWNNTVAFIDSSGNFESTWALAVPFGYGRARWASSQIPYHINATGGPTGTQAAIQGAAATWSDTGANFVFNYTGSTSAGWGRDGNNVISFGDLGGSTIIGQAITYMSGSTILEADILFNTRFSWSTATPTPGGSMDLESIALHELGHWLRLLDLYGANDASKVMYGFGMTGQAKRSLTASDRSGVQWIYGGADAIAPTPTPMTFATPPYQTGMNTIAMVATTATDPTTPIQYFFDFVDSSTGGAGGADSGWQNSTSYNNTGLQPNHRYGYRVRARDGVLNEAAYSSSHYTYTAIETPAGIDFGTITPTSIQVLSTNLPSGLTRGSSGLFFENSTNSTNSGWVQTNLWASGSLLPNTKYSFRARTRNGDGIETGYSPTSSKYTQANPPAASAFSNINQWGIRVNWAGNGNPSNTRYFCENTTNGANSGWIQRLSWNNSRLNSNTSYSFRVKARNADGVETDWVDLGTAQTSMGYPRTVTLISPSGEITTATPAYTWNAVSSATEYNLWVSDSTGVRIEQWFTAAEAGCGSGTGTCSVMTSVPLAAGAGKWRIQTKNPLRTGLWSTIMNFTVSP